LIFETSHDSSFEPTSKKYLPDKFLFCSDNQLIKFRSLDVPACVIEYPVDMKSKNTNRGAMLTELGLDPSLKHVLNVGLWTSRKNQAEIIEYARHFNDVQFHFVGNQAENFKDYWEPLVSNIPDNCTIWGERSDVEKFYSCMDLFLFTSRGHDGDKETNPLVMKEALSWSMPVLAHKLDSYLDKLDEKVTWLSEDFNINLVKLSRMLGLSDRLLNCSIDDTKVNFNFLNLYECFHEKLLCMYELDSDLLLYRSFIMTNAMWAQPHCGKEVLNGLTIRIFDAPKDYYSNLTDFNLVDHHHLLFEKSFTFKTEVDVKILGEYRKFYGLADDASSWFTYYETLIKEYYKQLELKEGDTVIDIGGHYGFFDLYALDKKVSHIHVIEPTKTSFDVLSKNLRGFKNVRKHNLAISSDNEDRTFNVVGPSATCTFHENYNTSEENPNSQGIIKKENVRCLTFDQFMKNNNIDRIDALKMDCEGAEWDILPTINDDFFKFKLRKFSMEAHEFGIDNMKERAEEFVSKLEGFGYQVVTEKEVKQGQTGNLWATRYPKIKIVHMLVDKSGEREKKSIKHLKKLSEYSGWEYVERVNSLQTELPPKRNCARPNDVQLEPGDYKLTPAHYGNYVAHKEAIDAHLNEGIDAILFCECDAIFIKPVHEVYRTIMDRLDDMIQHDLYFMNFGKRIPDWSYDEYEHFGITDRMSEAHCYLLSTNIDRRVFFREKFHSSKWDTYDLWLNDNIFNDEKCGIVKTPLSIQCSGNSYLDKSFKDGTTLLTDEDIEVDHENF